MVEYYIETLYTTPKVERIDREIYSDDCWNDIICQHEPFLATLKLANAPIANGRSLAEHLFDYQLRSVVPVHQRQLKVKSSDHVDFLAK